MTRDEVRQAIRDGELRVVSSGSSKIQRKRLHRADCRYIKPTSRVAVPSNIVYYESSHCACLT